MIFNHYIIGILEDNVWVYMLPHFVNGLTGCTTYIGYPTGTCNHLGSQPLIYVSIFFLTKISNPVFGYNLLIFGGMILNFIFAFKFFKKLFNSLTSSILTIVFLLSPYFYYHGRSHTDLIQFWLVIWFLDILFFSKTRYKSIYLGVVLAITTAVSNYLGYFTFLFTSLYLTFGFLFQRSKVLMIKKYYLDVIMATLVFILLSATYLTPYIRSSLLVSGSKEEKGNYVTVTQRPFEDFIIFSSRPWYYLMPSVDNPFLSGVSKEFLKRISSGGNYLTQNYFKVEHSDSFLGWVNICLGVVGGLFLLKTTKNRPNSDNESSVSFLVIFLCMVGLVILSMPPYVSISGVGFYTPSFILFKVFPMFRVLARLGVLILFLTLIFTGYGYKVILNLGASGRTKRFLTYFATGFLVIFSLVEFFVTIKIEKIDSSPQVYGYLSSIESGKFPIVVYPYSKTTEAIFWMSIYKQPIINPRGYVNFSTGFTSEDFTKRLNTLDGLEKAKNMGAKYLIYFYDEDKRNSAEFFANNPYLIKTKQFEEPFQGEKRITLPYLGKYVIAKVTDSRTGKPNSAILYFFK